MTRLRINLWTLVSVVFVLGCNGTNPSDSGSRVRIGLNWFPDAQHAGFYAADTQGYFDAQGLEVEILPGGPGVPVVQNVALKRLDFGVANADQVLMARAQGAPIVAVLASLQTSPRCIMVHRESKIDSLANLHDVTLALGAGKAFGKFLLQQLALKNVKVIPYTGSIALFLQDPRFAQQAYVFSEPFVARQRGADPVTLMVSELGFDPYTSCLVAHEDLVRSNPELVSSVVDSVRRGWLDYFRDPTPVHQRILTVNPQLNLASLEFGMQALQPLVLPESMNTRHIGSMAADRWQELSAQLTALGLLPAEFDSSTAFTTDFVPPLDANITGVGEP